MLAEAIAAVQAGDVDALRGLTAAQLFFVGKRAGRASVDQETINPSRLGRTPLRIRARTTLPMRRLLGDVKH